MTLEAKHELFKVLDKIGSKLDITRAQYEEAKKRYKAVGKWLADGEYCLTGGSKVCLKNGEIYPQGSIRLATAVKPIVEGEFDVDLVFFSPNVSTYDIDPSELNRLIGERLRENADYKRMMEASPNNGKLKRGWRITYADKFHLDITPSINNHREKNNSELVPDRKLQDWKPSNPKDYAVWFDKCSGKIPLFNNISKDSINITTAAHEVTNFPENDEVKPLLKRYVQILKRHRDEMFKKQDHKPISIIITTLATHAYNKCVSSNTYDNELDLLTDIIKIMPDFIEGYEGHYQISNPTTKFENFAERWNEVPIKKRTFDVWHSNALGLFETLYKLSGQHTIFKTLEEGFGKEPVSIVYDDINVNVEKNRGKGILGLGVGSTATASNPMKKNTFYGK